MLARVFQPIYFLGRQLSDMAYFQASIGYRAYCYPAQSANFVAHPPEQSTDFAVASLGQRHLQGCAGRTPTEDFRLAHAAGTLAIEVHAAAEFLQALAVESPFDGYAICLGHLVAGVGQMLGQLAVVAQQNQARAVGVQPADTVDPLGKIAQHFDEALSSLRIAGGAQHALGLVGQEVDMLLALMLADPLAVDENVVSGGVHKARQSFDSLVVDHDSAFDDHLLDGASAGQACLGKILLNANHPRRSGGLFRRCPPAATLDMPSGFVLAEMRRLDFF